MSFEAVGVMKSFDKTMLKRFWTLGVDKAGEKLTMMSVFEK
jgi:hypothetical protein